MACDLLCNVLSARCCQSYAGKLTSLFWDLQLVGCTFIRLIVSAELPGVPVVCSWQQLSYQDVQGQQPGTEGVGIHTFHASHIFYAS